MLSHRTFALIATAILLIVMGIAFQRSGKGLGTVDFLT